MSDELEVVSFSTVEVLWSCWCPDPRLVHSSVSFHELLEAGIAYGWSESNRRAYDSQSYLQKFAPRRARGTTSGRNLAIADRLEAEGRMKSAGRQALGR